MFGLFLFIIVFVFVIVLFNTSNSDENYRHYNIFSKRFWRSIPARFHSPRVSTQHQRQIPSQSSLPQQGLPLGPAVGNPYGTGVVRGSSIAPLQMQYRQIFTPRPFNTMSGQQQRAQHLAPGGLGHTGWVYRQTP